MPDSVIENGCTRCGSVIATGALSCPNCNRLVYSSELKRLAADAESAEESGKISDALALWRQAHVLLPRDTKQYQIISEKIVSLSDKLDSTSQSDAGKNPEQKKNLGITGLMVSVVVFVATKAKLLLLGLSKVGTVLTMLGAFVVYWQIWGWMFAAGFVLCTYVHEMGHVAALRRYGIPATAPTFIPGVGAFVRIKQHPATPNEDAVVGLAGPIWGLSATLFVYALFLLTDKPIYAAITHVSAFINLFNLLPLGPMDGGRGFNALSKPQRWLATLALGTAWWFTHDGMLLIIALTAFARALSNAAPKESNRQALLKYILLVAALTTLIQAVPENLADQQRREAPKDGTLETRAKPAKT